MKKIVIASVTAIVTLGSVVGEYTVQAKTTEGKQLVADIDSVGFVSPQIGFGLTKGKLMLEFYAANQDEFTVHYLIRAYDSEVQITKRDIYEDGFILENYEGFQAAFASTNAIAKGTTIEVLAYFTKDKMESQIVTLQLEF